MKISIVVEGKTEKALKFCSLSDACHTLSVRSPDDIQLVLA
jgi:hypothetical protein